jgi:hypothetical protein
MACPSDIGLARARVKIGLADLAYNSTQPVRQPLRLENRHWGPQVRTMSALIQLGPWYGHNITVARRTIAERRAQGALTVYVTAPITSPILEVAINGRSLYVLGFRRQGEHRWWEFEPDGDQPRLDPFKRIVRGPATYSNLGLAAGAEVVIQPWRLLKELSEFDGLMGDETKKRKLLLLIFLVAEALRFDSVKDACYRYVSNAATYFGAPDYYYANPADMAGHRFVFTEPLVQAVRNWRSRTEAGQPDVGLPWIG